MPKALLIIDYTNDFVADDGALTSGVPAQVIGPRLIELADAFLKNGDYVILPTDLHDPTDAFHPENKLFPPHNIEGSYGRQYFEPLQSWVDANNDNPNVYIFAKNRYSSFANTNLDSYLRSRKINELHLTGVCTDICVLHTGVDAYNHDYALTLHSDAVATFSPTGHTWAINHFKTVLGAVVTPDISLELD
ncbi:MAG: cysteine hydrolase [Lactobacillaceae bacterium]|nr:cysteine hydrolase [Lactobacillaceae bacterium]